MPLPKRQSTGLYRSFMIQIRRQIKALGWTMWMCDERCGLPPGYTAKALHPDTASGRQAKWDQLEKFVSGLFGGEVYVEVRKKIPASVSMGGALHQGDSEGARKMATYRLRNLSPAQRKKIAKHAANARWRRKREAARAAEVD